MYRVIDTTDGLYLGTVVNKEKMIVGNQILFEEFEFEPMSVSFLSQYVIMSNFNYVVILEEC